MSIAGPPRSGLDFVQEFQHIAILVSDIDRSQRWYTDVLGWREEWTQSMGRRRRDEIS